jgi:DNA-binding PadR family transcriptional regulator
MKYVILKLLRDKARHGYEVMKDLAERFEGYSPSPGTVYPTLQWLEDEGLVAARDVEGKKVYEITDAGRAFLDEHRDVVDDIFERVRDAVDQALGGAMGELNEAVGRLVKAAYRTACVRATRMSAARSPRPCGGRWRRSKASAAA